MDEEPLGETEIRVKEESVDMPVSDPKDSVNEQKPGEPITEEEVVQVINPHVKIESVETVDAPPGEPKIKVEEECAEMPVSDLNAHLEEPEPIMPSVESGMIQDVKVENVVSDEIVADKKDEVLIGESEIGANEKVDMTVSDPKHSLGEQIQVKPSTVEEVAQDNAEIIESCKIVAEKMDTSIGESKVAVEEKSPEMLVSDSKECLDGQNLDKGITQSAVQGESTKEDKTSPSDASEDVASADSETIQKTSQPLIQDSASGSSDPTTSIEDPDIEQISVTESNTTEGLDNLDPQTEQITDAQKPKTTTDVPVEFDNDGLSIAVSLETSMPTVCSSLIKETPKTLDATSDLVHPEVEGNDKTCGNVEVPQLDEIADSSQPLSSEKSAVSDEMISHLDSRVNATLLEDVPELTSGAIPTAEVQNDSAAVSNKDLQESKESENISSSLLSDNLSPVSEKKSGNLLDASKSLEQPIVEATKKDEVADDPRKEVSIDDEQPIESGESMDVSESTVPQLEVHKSGTMKETMEIVEGSSGAEDAKETEDREAVSNTALQTAQAPQEEISNLTEEPMGLTKSLEQPIDGAVHDDGGVAQKLLEGEDDLGKSQFAESSFKNVSEIASVESKPPIPTTESSQLVSPTSQVSILGIGSRLDDEVGNQESTDEITEKDDPLKSPNQDEMSQQIASFYDTLKEDTDPADYSADVTVLPPGTEDTNLAGGESESPEKRKDSQAGIKKDGGVEAFEEAKPSDETSSQPDGLATVQGSSITQPADDSDSKAADAEEETPTGIVEVEKEVRLARQPDGSNLKLSSIAESETESQETLKRKNEEPAPSPKKLKQALDEVACDENIVTANDSALRTASEDHAKEIVAAEAGSEPSDQSVASDGPTESGDGLQETEDGLEKAGQNSQATVTGGPELDKVADVELSKNDIRNEDKIGDTICDSNQGNEDFDLSSRPSSVAEQAEEREPATTSEDPEAVKSKLASEDVVPQKLVLTESPEEREPTTTAEDAEAVKSELASEDVDPQKLVTEESSATNIPEESSKLEVAPKTQEPPASEASEPKSSLAIVLLEKLCDEAVERSSNSNSSVCGDVALDDLAEDAADNPPESIASNALESVDSEDLQSPTQPKKRGRPSRLPKSPRSTRGRKKAATPSRSTRAQKSAIDETQDETGDAEDSTTGEFENSEQETVAPAEESSVPETEGRRSLRQRVVKNYSDQTEEPAEEHSDASDDVLENSEDEVETGVRPLVPAYYESRYFSFKTYKIKLINEDFQWNDWAGSANLKQSQIAWNSARRHYRLLEIDDALFHNRFVFIAPLPQNHLQRTGRHLQK
ncbi:unnamed protein product [Nesidiocoris tenuis]|uniref:Uncharacterized protein n=1 Tax=Nesidiocoris tenuis TaxID=355587 RepID=A0A6H5GN30_9HEMI|nr:unnamed protein product [Nesidiocoris tenuis]